MAVASGVIRCSGLIRQSGHGGIAATIRDTEYENDLLYALLRITPDQ